VNSHSYVKQIFRLSLFDSKFVGLVSLSNGSTYFSEDDYNVVSIILRLLLALGGARVNRAPFFLICLIY
jgi:hypothetical protein